jgi:hypothetical protein
MLFSNNRIAFFLLITIGLIGLGAFFCLSFYNHPTIDDFGHADAVKTSGLWQAQKFQFQTRTGRFASTLVVGLFNPLLFSHWLTGIKVYPALFLLSFITLFHFFLSGWFHKQIPFLQLFPFSVVLFICFILKLESVLELFYWFAANCVYGIPMLLFLLNLYLFFRLLRAKDTPEAYRLMAGICLLGVMLCGSNELDLVNTVILNFLVLVYLFYTRPRKISLAYLVCFILIAAAALFSLSAPGNVARAKTLNEDINSLLSFSYVGNIFLVSAKHVLLQARTWILSLPLISASALLAVLIWKYQSKALFRFKSLNQLLAYMGLVYLMLILQIFPVLYNRGLAGLVDRAANVIWFHFFLYWIIGLLLFIPFLKEERKIVLIISKDAQIKLFNAMLSLFLAAVLTSFHIRQAYQDLLFKAPAYDAGLKKRYDTIRLASRKGPLALQVQPVFPHWQHYPKSLCKLELSQDPATYFNSSVASYFGLESITLAGPSEAQAK